MRPRSRVTVGLAVVLLAGCTYARTEPGLLGRSASTPAAVQGPIEQQSPPDPRPRTNPALPVAGEAVWTSDDGLDVQVRIAVHAVRRIDGGTVLDWSVTPLRGPGLGPDDVVPASLNLGLSRPVGATTNAFLVADGVVYRPLTRTNPTGRGCSCSPVWLAQRYLRIGRTTLLQLAFPTLPADVDTVDVDIATVSPFSRVPVTPAGFVPLARRGTDLARPARASADLRSTRAFTYAPTGQRFRIAVRRLSASDGFSSLSWSVSSVTSGPGLDAVQREPFADGSAGYNPAAASGPQLMARSVRYHARLITTSEHAGLECLCSDLRQWGASLRSAGQRASLVTNFPPLPDGVRAVTVIFPGLASLSAIPVSAVRAADTTFDSAGPVRAAKRVWTSGTDQLLGGWADTAWPTPVPRRADLQRDRADVDRLVVG